MLGIHHDALGLQFQSSCQCEGAEMHLPSFTLGSVECSRRTALLCLLIGKCLISDNSVVLFPIIM